MKMGAGASALAELPPKIDKATAKALSGSQFDEAKFNLLAKNGEVTKEEFIGALPAVAAATAAASKTPVSSKNKSSGLAAQLGAGKAPKSVTGTGAKKKGAAKGKGGGMLAKAKEEAAAAAAAGSSSSADVALAEEEDDTASQDTAATRLQALTRGRQVRRAAPAAAPPAPEPELPSGEVMVRYNHYTTKFPLTKGAVRFEDIDEKYAISFVFKGAWTCYLTAKDPPDKRIHPDGDGLHVEMRPDPMGFDDGDMEEVTVGSFSGLVLETGEGHTQEYTLHVDEDPEDAKKPKTTYKAEVKDDGLTGGNRAEGCSCIWGNPCATADPCKDWHNRFEVAKKNGWKGF